VSQTGLFNKHERADSHCFAIGSRKSDRWISSFIVLTSHLEIVPVVQRIERRFPKAKTPVLLESADILAPVSNPRQQTEIGGFHALLGARPSEFEEQIANDASISEQVTSHLGRK
jgi:hypothetical protein